MINPATLVCWVRGHRWDHHPRKPTCLRCGAKTHRRSTVTLICLSCGAVVPVDQIHQGRHVTRETTPEGIPILCGVVQRMRVADYAAWDAARRAT